MDSSSEPQPVPSASAPPISDANQRPPGAVTNLAVDSPQQSVSNQSVDNQSRGNASTSASNPTIPPPTPQNHSHSIRLMATIRSPPTPNQHPPTNNNNGEFPQQTQNLFVMRDRLFLALFFRISLMYARAVPKFVRRVLEFILLMQSIILLCTLGYIHLVYTQTPITCLEEYKGTWPRDGILRVEITSEPPEQYTIAKSYEKEERLRQRNAQGQMGTYSNDDLLSMMLTADTMILDKAVSSAGQFFRSLTSGGKSVENAESEVSSTDDPVAESMSESSTVEPLKPSERTPPGDDTFMEGDTDILHQSQSDETISKNTSESSDGIIAPGVGEIDEDKDPNEKTETINHGSEEEADNVISISPSFPHNTASGEGSLGDQVGVFDVNDPNSPYFNMTMEEIEVLKQQQKQNIEESLLKSSVSDFEMFSNSVWLTDHAYIVEYSLEYGFLRLSPQTRQRLNITVKIVTLDPRAHTCFGNNFSRFLLDHFLGYDDILMSSIKNLAEKEENKGYLRNVVTGEQFRFVPMWMARSAYLPALLIMLVFTISISMLLRYSHHQIFVFIVDLLNNVEGNGAIHIPAAPLFTVILALVGMEAIMSEFFNDTSTAFYVILIVWVADQYDSVCCHTNATRTYWVRFFYLYHFVFYAYHYRFNGQYGGLALLTSWSFVQHSMVYFYHHYELPTILRQAHQNEERLIWENPLRGSSAGSNQSTPESRQRNNRPSSTTATAGSNSSTPTPSSDDSDSPVPPRRYNVTVSAELTFTRPNTSMYTTSTSNTTTTSTTSQLPLRPPSPRTSESSAFLTSSSLPPGDDGVSSYGLRFRNPSTLLSSPVIGENGIHQGENEATLQPLSTPPLRDE